MVGSRLGYSAINIPDLGIWRQVKEGELNSFSIEIIAIRSNPGDGDPPVVTGLTEAKEGHDHTLQVTFDMPSSTMLAKTCVSA
jgi:hypothetical protein